MPPPGELTLTVGSPQIKGDVLGDGTSRTQQRDGGPVSQTKAWGDLLDRKSLTEKSEKTSRKLGRVLGAGFAGAGVANGQIAEVVDRGEIVAKRRTLSSKKKEGPREVGGARTHGSLRSRGASTRTKNVSTL